ncbi:MULTISPECIES: TIGR00366 family protein [Corynebacterium]|nr:TIGR00366 family protein [Corynebacterium hadale]WKC61271.1 Short-chain fatty acids transporter [Corynebacterium hadale]
MAFACGDTWTNQIPPFWALPLLGVAGRNARSMVGYRIVWLLTTGVIICAGLMLLTLF